MPRTPNETLPEVESFITVQKELDIFKADNPEFFEALDDLMSRYNAALEMADKAVRAKQISSGPFRLTGRPTVLYKAQELFEEMGQDFFFEHGGMTERVLTYTLDKPKMEAAYAAGLIPEEVAVKVRSVRASFHKPDKLVLP